VLPSVVSVFRDRIVDHDAVFDLTVPESVLDELLASQRGVVEECLDSGRLTLRTASTSLDYSLLLVEQRDRTAVCALVYGDSGVAGVVKNDTDDAVRWADRVYERLPQGRHRPPGLSVSRLSTPSATGSPRPRYGFGPVTGEPIR